MHELDHVTSGPGNTSSTFDGTGAGVAMDDLDLDGDLDLVFANLFNESTILENTGELGFDTHHFVEGRFRGVATPDIDRDGRPDIVMTTGIGPPVAFIQGAELGDVERQLLTDVRSVAYSMAWGDLDGDGDLDLATGSYNAELSLLRNSPVLGDNTGLIVHRQVDDGWDVDRLAESAQALALLIGDLDDDGRSDVLIGNDLSTPDQLWLDTGQGFVLGPPFERSSYSTMSYDAADIDNDLRIDLLSTDMKPLDDSDDRYREVAADLAAAPVVDDIQTPENVLQMGRDGGWDVGDSGIAATGWSWSGLFGDLDNDADLDLYVATGMQSDELFGFLPNARLIEPNAAFRNESGSLRPTSDWQLEDLAGGRGMAIGDLDGDGDLDIAVNTLDEPSRLFENQLCGGRSVIIRLIQSSVQNRRALGARVRISGENMTQQRTLIANRGYLSSAPPEAHIGVGDSDTVSLEVRWPDGSITKLDDLPTGSTHTITRTD